MELEQNEEIYNEALERMKDQRQKEKIQERVKRQDLNITPVVRERLVCMLIQQCSKYDSYISQRTKELAISLFDLYLRNYSICSSYYQLLAIASLHVAIKANESWCYQVNHLAYYYQNFFSKEQLLHMEFILMRLTKWNVNRIIPADFIEILFEFTLKNYLSEEEKEMILKIVDISNSCFELTNFKPSVFALGSILYIIRNNVNDPDVESQVMEEIAKINDYYEIDFEEVDLFVQTLTDIIDKPIEQQAQANEPHAQLPFFSIPAVPLEIYDENMYTNDFEDPSTDTSLSQESYLIQ